MNAQIYRLLLGLCPADLRREFGAEMTQVFLEDLEDQRRRGGWMGAARVWWRSVRELRGIALPELASRREVVVPFVMGLLQLVLILLSQCDPYNTPRSIGDLLLLIFAMNLIPTVIGSAVLQIGNRSVPVPLNLRS
jgi:hypothetical protein